MILPTLPLTKRALIIVNLSRTLMHAGTATKHEWGDNTTLNNFSVELLQNRFS